MTTSLNLRNLISFQEGWDVLMNNELFQTICSNPPAIEGLEFSELAVVDLKKLVNVEDDLVSNEARAGGVKLKKNDLHKGWDPSERPLVIVRKDGELHLWDGFNRYYKLTDQLGVWSAPAWIYDLVDPTREKDLMEIVQLSFNNHGSSEESTRQDFVNTGVRWAARNDVTDLDEIRDWINASDHNHTKRNVDKIASSILCESEVGTNVRHIKTGSAARKEACEYLDRPFEYNKKEVDPLDKPNMVSVIDNPIMMACNNDDYIKDAFIAHMTKQVRQFKTGQKVDVTEFVGYTKNCEDQKSVEDQRNAAMKRIDQLEEIVSTYAFLKMQLNGKSPYEWKGFLPQLFGRECGEGIIKSLIRWFRTDTAT